MQNNELTSPLFSVLVANYNNGKYLEDCLQSIFSQTYQNWEVVIVDDASTDNSQYIYDRYINHPRIQIIHNKQNRGVGFTKRKCIVYARGKICGFLDPDDAIMPEAVEVMVRAHLDNPNCSVISSKFYFVDKDLSIVKEGKIGEIIPDGYSYLTYGRWAITAFATFKRNYYAKTEGINLLFKAAVDQDLYYKLEETGRHLFINQFLYLYRITPQSISKKDYGYNAHKWYFQAMKDAYFRRLANNPPVKNFSKEQFRYREYLFAKERIAHERNKHRYIRKYYFLFKAIILYPTLDIKYKIKCLLIPFFA